MRSKHKLPYKDLYPLARGNFNGIALTIPKNVKSVLITSYGPSVTSFCHGPHYSYKMERFITAGRGSVTKIPCDILFEMFHFSKEYKAQYESAKREYMEDNYL